MPGEMEAGRYQVGCVYDVAADLSSALGGAATWAEV